ncbi:TetR family transcriptional regulator [Mycolicibacter minnesotensis]|uniref:TetR family transcriptional regulator n=1 Tax=Mycolicibacter minnesotensis TaxID=1118379 RepID=A0A7I7R9W2_9MYCO|nr:TetR/AcrR family transcriptional regulator [Mycolicibacter minnesotensis]ORB04379.1 TetR family transcriptional regulator [Mycolicibacter minnesotensis]BBY34957.1 putative TetR-family transcriptional regulator [Mycolicibacter minnesotensis]
MSASIKTYHHGDLPGTLLRAAMDLLEENGATELSLRAAARRAGVSTAAPYRHFADRNALLSAIAAVGYQELAAELIAAHPSPKTADDFAALAVAYVQFAVNRPGLFRVMFTEQCDLTDAERAAAVTAIQEYLNSIVRQVFPSSDPEAMAIAVWGLVHGLAFLHLDGKLDTSSKQVIADRVRAAVLAAAGQLS